MGLLIQTIKYSYLYYWLLIQTVKYIYLYYRLLIPTIKYLYLYYQLLIQTIKYISLHHQICCRHEKRSEGANLGGYLQSICKLGQTREASCEVGVTALPQTVKQASERKSHCNHALLQPQHSAATRTQRKRAKTMFSTIS